MDTMEKLRILSDAAKYDAACTSSGAQKSARRGGIGSTEACGICHSFAGDGRCISLLKVLQSNACSYDCAYCVNRRSNDTRRASFSPRELAELTIAFYRRNYIEGLFLSSGVAGTPDAATETMIETLRILREEYRFSGYIHAKAIPSADAALVRRLGLLADRLSVNIELPSGQSLQRLAPDKTKAAILAPMSLIRGGIDENRRDLVRFRNSPHFAPAGQSTQMIIGATNESDRQILTLTAALYERYRLKRVFYSAYIPVNDARALPPVGTPPPLWREHRLYQADWLLRFYGFSSEELFHGTEGRLHPYLDPKCHWALRHKDIFPLEVNRAPYELLLRVPGVGVKSAWRITRARRAAALTWDALAKIGVVTKRARHFLIANGKRCYDAPAAKEDILLDLMSPRERALFREETAPARQLSLFGEETPTLSPMERKELSCLAAPM